MEIATARSTCSVRTSRVLLLVVFNVSLITTYSQQNYIGVGYGTFNVPAAYKFRGYGPTISFERYTFNPRVAWYFDLSYFNKKQQSVDAETKFSYLYSQTGLKVLFFGDFDEKKFLGFISGGIALVYSQTVISTSVDKDQLNRFIFGFHLGAGLQYRFSLVILQLKATGDLDIKPLVYDADVSNIISNLRLSVLIPISKWTH